jgi:hypothetical protein
MYRLRARSWAAFERNAVEDFEHRMGIHLRKFFAVQCTSLGEEQVRRLIRYGIERGRSHGLTSERGVCTYIDMMFAFGREFDREVPWAAEIFARKDIDTPQELENCLFFHGLRHRDEARGIGVEAGLP